MDEQPSHDTDSDQQRERELLYDNNVWRIPLENAVKGDSRRFGHLHHAWCESLLPCSWQRCFHVRQFVVQTSQNTNNARRVALALESKSIMIAVVIVFRCGQSLWSAVCKTSATRREGTERLLWQKKCFVDHQNTGEHFFGHWQKYSYAIVCGKRRHDGRLLAFVHQQRQIKWLSLWPKIDDSLASRELDPFLVQVQRRQLAVTGVFQSFT